MYWYINSYCSLSCMKKMKCFSTFICWKCLQTMFNPAAMILRYHILVKGIGTPSENSWFHIWSKKVHGKPGIPCHTREQESCQRKLSKGRVKKDSGIYFEKAPTSQKGNNLNTMDNNFKLNIKYVLIHISASM